MKSIYFIVVIGLLVLGGVGIIVINNVFFANNKNNGAKVSVTTEAIKPSVNTSIVVDPSTTVQATVSITAAENVQITPPANWKAIENDTQGYTAYRPSNWYFRMFPPNKQTLGIDPQPIPDASDYGGMILFNRATEATYLQDIKDSLQTGYSETTQEINGRTWTMIEGKTKENEIYGVLSIKYAIVTVNGKTFHASIMAENTNYGGLNGTFTTFINTVIFK